MIFRLSHIIIIALFAMAATGLDAAHPDEGVHSYGICSDPGGFFVASAGSSYCGELENPSSNPRVLNEGGAYNELRNTGKHHHENDGQSAVACPDVSGGQYSGISLILANIRHQSHCRILLLIGRLNI